jgi:hypothetical protein
MDTRELDARLAWLASQGITVSFGHGPTPMGTKLMVQAMRTVDYSSEQWDAPIVSLGFAEAIADVEAECVSRGWVDEVRYEQRPTRGQIARGLLSADTAQGTRRDPPNDSDTGDNH